MYFPDVLPWIVGKALRPPPDVWGRFTPLMNDPGVRWDDELGRIDELSELPMERFWPCDGLKMFLCWSGRAKFCPS
jgi:hypothetical protein